MQTCIYMCMRNNHYHIHSFIITYILTYIHRPTLTRDFYNNV